MHNLHSTMLNKYFAMIILGVCSFLFVGCESTESSYSRGEIAALGVLIAFDSPTDVEKIRATSAEIKAFLDRGDAITIAVLEQYALKIAERHGKNMGAVRIVLMKIKAELNLETGPSRADEFLRGLTDTLTIALE